MRFDTTATVSSQALKNLQNDLINLAAKLNECYELLYSDMTILHESWDDPKFDEFENEFRSRKEKILEISEKYNVWASTYLPPRIEIIEKAENGRMGI